MVENQVLAAATLFLGGFGITLLYLAHLERVAFKRSTRWSKAFDVLGTLQLLVAAWCAGTLFTRLVLHIALH